MEKKNIFKKIDTMYTKVVKVIIGDLPLQELKPENYDTSTTKENTEQAKYIYKSLKDKFLNLGVPENEKELLYKEVVKREKKEVRELKEEVKKETTTKKTILTSKKSDTQTSSTNPSTSKPMTKKTSTQNKEEDTKKVVVTPKSTKIAPTKKTKKTKTTPSKSNTKKETTTKKLSKTKEKVSKEKKTKVKKYTSTINREKTTPKTKPAPRGAKKAAKIALYIKDIKKHYGEVDEDFVAIIVNNLGPSIYKKDAELVSCSDPKELDTVRKSFLKKKLGIDASKGVLDAAIQDVCIELKGVRNKYRATFYYALAKKFKKESVLS